VLHSSTIGAQRLDSATLNDTENRDEQSARAVPYIEAALLYDKSRALSSEEPSSLRATTAVLSTGRVKVDENTRTNHSTEH